MSGDVRVEYVDLSADALRMTAANLLPFFEAAAIMVRDEIVSTIEDSTPAGREYPIPGVAQDRTKSRRLKARGQLMRIGYYRASAPGQAPAVRLGEYRNGWRALPPVIQGNQIIALVVNVVRVGRWYLAVILEFGSGRMAPRPHVRPALASVSPKIAALAARVR